MDENSVSISILHTKSVLEEVKCKSSAIPVKLQSVARLGFENEKLCQQGGSSAALVACCWLYKANYYCCIQLVRGRLP